MTFFEETARRFINFVADSFMFFIGIVGTIIATLLTLTGEFTDELGRDPGVPYPWIHVLKVVIPPCAVAVLAYLKHRDMMANAINSPSPMPYEKATIMQQDAPKKDQ